MIFSSRKAAAGLFFALTAFLPFAFACSKAESDVQPSSSTQVVDGVTVRDAWARIADSSATGGAYFTLINSSGSDLQIAGLTSSVADTVELHETAQHDGMMHMTPVEAASVGAGDSLVMKSGGMHLMFIRLHNTLAAGDSIPLTIHFTDRESVSISIPVRSP